MPKFIVLELSDSEAMVLHFSHAKKKGMLLEDALTVDFSDLSRDEESIVTRGARIRDRLKQQKITTVECGLIIPKQNSIVRVTTLPSTDHDELEQMAQFKAEEYIPFNAERHIISHGILRQDGVKGSDVLITAVDGPVMEKAMAICKEARLEPRFAEVSSIALVRAFSQYQHEALQESSLLIINIGRSQTDIIILKDGLLVATRSQPLGVEHLNREMVRVSEEEVNLDPRDLASTKTQAWIERITRFTRQTYEFALREHNVAHTSHLFISGEGSQQPGLAATLAQGLGVEVTIFNPAEPLQKSPKGTVEPDTVPGLATPLGTALRLIEEDENPKARIGRINLLPMAVLEEQQASERRVLLMISGTMVFITLVLGYLAFQRQQDYREELSRIYRQSNREMAQTVQDLDEKQERIQIIETKKGTMASPMVILDQVSAFPRIGASNKGGRLTLEQFRFIAGDEVTFAGTAMELEDIGDFTDYLARLSYNGRPVFSEIGIPTNSPVDLSQKRGTVYSFSFTASLTTEGGTVE